MSVSLQGNLVKKAHKKHKYTDAEIKHLKKCADPKKGPLYFAENFLSIQHPTKGSIKFEPLSIPEKTVKKLQ